MYNLPEAASSIPVAQPQAAPKRRGWMKWLGVIVSILVLLRGLVAIADLTGILTDYGTKIEYTSSELYYTAGVTEDEARKVGDALQTYGYFGTDQAVSVQLTKVDGTYQVRFVVQEDKINDESVTTAFTVIGTLIQSEALNNAPAEVHLCDDSLETLRVLKL